MIALIVAALVGAQPAPVIPNAPFLPPEPIKSIVYTTLPDPGANKFRLCQGKVCVEHHEGRDTRLTITIPLGRKQ